MKDDTLQRNNTGFPSGTDSPYYMEMPTFSALKFVTCKSPRLSGYAFKPHYPSQNNFQNKSTRQGF